MIGVRTTQKLIALVTAGLLASVALAAPVTAANTRDVFIGDPADVAVDPPPFTLDPTPVSPGAVTKIDVLVKNLGGQTLTHAVLGIGTEIAPPGVDLPAGWSVRSITPSAGCSFDGPSGASDGASCSLGDLSAGASRQVRILLNAGSVDGAIEVSATVAERQGRNVGDNNNTFIATTAGTGFELSPGGADQVSTFLDDEGVVGTQGGTGSGGLSTRIGLLNDNDGNGHTVQLRDDASGPDCSAAGVDCLFGLASEAHVNDGAPVDPYFEWTTTWTVPKSFSLTKKTGIVHFFDDGSFETFVNDGSASCEDANPPIPCVSFSLSKNPDDKKTNILVVTFRTDENGRIKVF